MAPAPPAGVRSRHRRALVLVALLLGALVGCTPDDPPAADPSPPPSTSPAPRPLAGGPRVAVVLPARADGTAPDAQQQLEALERDLADDIGELRVVVPNAEAFAGDVVRLLADDGYDLVCVLGADSEQIVTAAVRSYPATHFCALPAAAEDIPDHVRLVDVRATEVAYVAGAAAAAHVAQSPPVLLTRASGDDLDALRRALVNGYRSGGGRGDAVVIEVQPGVDEAEDVARGVPAADGRSILLDAGAMDAALLEALAPRLERPLVVGDVSLLDDRPDHVAILAVRRQLAVLFGSVIGEPLDAFESGSVSRGFADDALSLVTEGTGASARVRRAAQAAVDRIVAGEVDVLEPPPAGGPSPTSDSADVVPSPAPSP